jgi:hypothetical protein
MIYRGRSQLNTTMETDTVIRTCFTLLFLATLSVGAYLLKNFDRLFGADPDMPSENSSSRTYTKLQVFVVWMHAVVLTGGFAFLMH